MSDAVEIAVRPVGWVRSDLRTTAGAPKQGRGSGQRATIELEPAYEPAARDIRPGDRLWVLTWLHLADRERLRGHPRGDVSKPERGVFSLRSPIRPNPIGLTLVEVVKSDGRRIEVEGLEVVDGTPVLDLKPYLEDVDR